MILRLVRRLLRLVSFGAVIAAHAGLAVGWEGTIAPQLPAAFASATPAACPVTLPNGSVPPGENPSPGQHGNGALWTDLWPDGVVLIPAERVRPDGSLDMKWPWWRGVPGRLWIEGRRLDADAPPLRAEAPGGARLDRPATPAPGVRYGEGTPGFQATTLIFPTEGCWEVTGHVDGASLTFVTRVERVDRWPWDATPAAGQVSDPDD